MKFSIIIVNEDASSEMDRYLNRALAAIAAQTQRDFEVLVANPAAPLPDDERFKVVQVKTENIIAAKNIAAQQAQSEWLFFISPTTFMADTCLESLYAASLRYPDCAMFACTQLEDAQTGIIAAAGKCYSFLGIPFCGGKGWPVDVLPDEGECFGACTPSIFIRRDVFEKIGRLDAEYIMTCEDADLSFRLRLAGHYAMLASEAMVFIKEPSSIPDAHYYATRNIIWTFLKNMPDILFWLLLPFHIAAIALLLCNPVLFVPRMKGVFAALRHLPQIWKKRQLIQAARKTSYEAIARSLSWKFSTLFWRTSDVRRRT